MKNVNAKQFLKRALVLSLSLSYIAGPANLFIHAAPESQLSSKSQNNLQSLLQEIEALDNSPMSDQQKIITRILKAIDGNTDSRLAVISLIKDYLEERLKLLDRAPHAKSYYEHLVDLNRSVAIHVSELNDSPRDAKYADIKSQVSSYFLQSAEYIEQKKLPEIF
jgi:hypothetical protein